MDNMQACYRAYRNFFSMLLLLIALVACSGNTVTVTKSPAATGASGASSGKILFLAGPDSHGPGEHEHRAGSELLAQSLQQLHPGFETINVYGGWPDDESLFAGVDAVVIYCDGGRGHLINKHLEVFNHLLAEGVGVVALHYGVEVPRGSASARAMLRAIGGYFETDWSVNPHWEADYTALPRHSVTEGVSPFKQRDEWYFNMRFQPGMEGVTPVLSAIAPAETMARGNGRHSGNDAVRKLVAEGVPQVTAWAFEREGGGRGFGYTGGHFHANWDDDNARNLVLNAIVWTADGHQL